MTLCEQYRDILVFLGCSPQQQVPWTNIQMLECKAASLLGSSWTLRRLAGSVGIGCEWLRLVTGWHLKHANTGQRSCGGSPHSSQQTFTASGHDRLDRGHIDGKNGKTGKLGQDRLEVRWEAVMFLFNLVI